VARTETISLELFTHLARTSLLLGNLQERCLEPFGLRFIDYSVLRIVRLAAPERLSPTRLADEVVCTTGGMTKMLDRLEGAGLVMRQPDPLDKRGRLVVLTRRGERVIDRASDAYRDERERLLGHLGAGEATDIDAALRRLLAVLEADRHGTDRDGGPVTEKRG
jgi:DNA-binding MarR family transcriptional regulator